MKRLDGKLALITGASRGIGAAVAKRYAQEGAHVIIAARTVGGLEEVDDAIQAIGGKATIVPLDLLKLDTIDALGLQIAERFGKLDIIVGNAGMLGTLSPVGHITPSVWEKVFTINVTANYRLIRSLDALLKASEAGRAIFVTSGASRLHIPFWGAYAASKAALETLIQTYAAEQPKNSNIKANIIDPGVVGTKMRAVAMPGEDPASLPSPDDITDLFVTLAEHNLQENGTIFHIEQETSKKYG